MPLWESTPPPLDDSSPYRLVRVPADRAVRGVITCTDIVGARTHFARNRTYPCPGQTDCPLCGEGFTWRWHAYVSLVTSGTFEHVILELTAAGSEPLRNYAQVHLDVRGCEINAFRPSKKHNGRVVVACKKLDLQRIRIPEPPNIQRILCHIWGIQYEAPKNNRRTRPGAVDIHLPESAGTG